MFDDFRIIHEIVQVSVPGAIVDAETPEGGTAGEETHGDGGGVSGVSGVDEGGEEDFVDGTEGGEEVFFLFFHVVDEGFKVFACEVGTAGELTHCCLERW